MGHRFRVTNMHRMGIFKYGMVVFLIVLMSSCFLSSIFASQDSAGKPVKDELVQKTRTLQMPFIANNGQVDKQVMFYAKTFGGTVFVTNGGEIVYALPGANNSSGPGFQDFESVSMMHKHRGRNLKAGIQDNRAPSIVRHESYVMHHASCHLCLNHFGLNKFSLFNTFYSYLSALTTSTNTPRSVVLKETLLGARIAVITGEQPSVTMINYFTGNDKSKWKTNVPTFNMVSLGEVYQGVELRLKAYGDNVEKLFCVKPGGSPGFIKVQLGGSESLRINQDGQLEVETALGTIAFTKPIAYQEIGGKRVDVVVEYRIQPPMNEEPEAEGRGAGGQGCRREVETRNPKLTYGFTVASYDKTKDLIIDPLLASTFLGGSSDDYTPSLAIDISRNVYVAGSTSSSDFPTMSGAYDTSFNDGWGDVFISKLNSGLTSLLASTFLGGSGWDKGHSLAIDASGNVYVTGSTSSSNFPTTSGAYDTSYNGGLVFRGDVFVSKLDSGLTSLLASTYLGGSDDDNGSSLAIDISGDVCVTGCTHSTDFPTTSGAYDTSYNGSVSDEDGGDDVFVLKLNSELTSLLASTFLGGSEVDLGKSLALDTSGNIYVAGFTVSTDFPTTSGAYDTSFNGGGRDAFVSKLNSELTGMLASTYLGGTDDDNGTSLAIDISGNVYVTGWTYSADFPATSGAYDTSFNNGDCCSDVFVSKLDSGLTSLLVSTFLGGTSEDYAQSLTLDTSGNVYVTGYTYSTNFPTTSGAYDTSFNSGGYTDVFVSKLNSGLTSLLASTFLGGTYWDSGFILTLDTSGNVYVAGSTWSTDFPATSGAYDTSFNGGGNGRSDVFVSKLDGNLSADVCTYSISPTRKSFCASGGDGSIRVTVSGNCTWTAVSNEAWIVVTSGSSGTANGTVTYSVSANTGAGERTGTITVAGETFTVIEDGNSCKYTISPTRKSFGFRGGKGRVMVKAKSGCCWTATSNAAWISVKSGDSGEGNGVVAFSVSANTGTSNRTGTMSIAGKVFTVTQSGTPCTYSISPVSASFNANSGGGTIGVRTSSESCTWTAVSNATWITITSGGSGTGSHVSVTYSVSANTGTSDRTGTISVAGKIFTVKQSRGK